MLEITKRLLESELREVESDQERRARLKADLENEATAISEQLIEEVTFLERTNKYLKQLRAELSEINKIAES